MSPPDPESVTVLGHRELARRVEGVLSALAPGHAVVRLEPRGPWDWPEAAIGVVADLDALGSGIAEVLRHGERDVDARLPTLVLGVADHDPHLAFGREHVTWIASLESDRALEEWLRVPLEVSELRRARRAHEEVARGLQAARGALRLGATEISLPTAELPCGPALPTHLDEVLSLREARASFERGVIRRGLIEFGSIKDTARRLGISYTSLWRRMRAGGG